MMQAAPHRAFNALLDDFREEHPDSQVTCDDVPDHLIEKVESAMQQVYDNMVKQAEKEDDDAEDDD